MSRNLPEVTEEMLAVLGRVTREHPYDMYEGETVRALVIEVPQKDAATFDQDLAIVGKGDFDAGHRMPDRSEPGRSFSGDG